MATFRVGIGSFNINDGSVGIGTEGTGHGNLKVEGTLKSTNLDVLGVSTFTRYSGFSADEVNVSNRDLTLSGEYSTTGDIVVEDGASLTVGLGSTACVGSVECISVKHHFSVPVGDTAQRNETSGYGEGTVRYNRDLGTMEFFNGSEWRQFTYIADIQNSPSSRGRGLSAGGALNVGGNQSKIIESIQIQTLGSAQNFGDLITAVRYNAACASNIRGIFAGGIPNTDVIEYVTIPSEGNATDFGNLQNNAPAGAGLSSQTRGLFAGGYSPARNTIDYIEINTTGNALDFGDLFTGKYYGSGCASPVRGIFQGMTANNTSEGRYQYVTIASKGNSTEWGEPVYNRTAASFASNSVRGILAGGVNAEHPWFNIISTSIEHITLASTGSAEYFGDLSHYRSNSFNGCSTSTRAVFCGGAGDTVDSPSATLMDTCEFVEIASSGNAQDFGDLSQPRRALGQCSDSHGGLGGY